MHPSDTQRCGEPDANLNLFPYPRQRSRGDLPKWIPRLDMGNRLIHLHSCRPGPISANDVFLISQLREIGHDVAALHGVNQPGYSVARHMAELLSGLPVGTIDKLATHMMGIMGVDAADPEAVSELISLPAADVSVPRHSFESVLRIKSIRLRGDDDGPSVQLDRELLGLSQDAAMKVASVASVEILRHDFVHNQRVSADAYSAAVLSQLKRLRRRDVHAFRELVKRFGSVDQMRRSSRVQRHAEIIAGKTCRGGSASMWGRPAWLTLALTGRLDSPARLLMLGVRAEELARHRLAAEGVSLVTAADSVRAAVTVGRELSVPVVVQEFMRSGGYRVYDAMRGASGAQLRQAPICAWDSQANPDFMVGVLELLRRQDCSSS